MTTDEYMRGLYAVRAENLAKLVKARQFNSYSMHRATGISTSTARAIVYGEYSMPPETVMRKIEHALGFDYNVMDAEDFRANEKPATRAGSVPD